MFAPAEVKPTPALLVSALCAIVAVAVTVDPFVPNDTLLLLLKTNAVCTGASITICWPVVLRTVTAFEPVNVTAPDV